MKIKIATILGSAQRKSRTGYALNAVHKIILEMGNIDLIPIKPSEMKLYFPGMEQPDSQAEDMRKMVKSAHGIILATPEYHGSFSSLLKLVIENLGFPSALSKKPVALLGVAGGRIGAIKSLEALASVCLHVGAIVIPGPVSIAKAGDVFDSSGFLLDEDIEKKLSNFATNLVNFICDTSYPDVCLEKLVRTPIIDAKIGNQDLS